MSLDLNLIRGIITAVLFALFIAVCVWAWSSRRRDDFEAAARLPFDAPEDGEEHSEEMR